MVEGDKTTGCAMSKWVGVVTWTLMISDVLTRPRDITSRIRDSVNVDFEKMMGLGWIR